MLEEYRIRYGNYHYQWGRYHTHVGGQYGYTTQEDNTAYREIEYSHMIYGTKLWKVPKLPT
jgi:hypothetical protein